MFFFSGELAFWLQVKLEKIHMNTWLGTQMAEYTFNIQESREVRTILNGIVCFPILFLF